MKKGIAFQAVLIIIVVFMCVGMVYVKRKYFTKGVENFSREETRNIVNVESANIESTQATLFERNQRIEETGVLPRNSKDPWWLSSGAYFYVDNGLGQTVHGNLDKLDPWRLAYLKNNPEDTEQGYKPQNIFRLVFRNLIQNYTQEVYFRIDNINMTKSVNRNSSNGIFLFNRYMNEDNIYYTGIRVDGAVVVKKKIAGKYYTMYFKNYYPGNYLKDNNPNLIPVDKWIGLKSEITNTAEGVNIKVYMDPDMSGEWELVADTTDVSGLFGESVFAEAGYTGIRTDFLDVSFTGYSVKTL